ncbi:MAG: rhodanese-like domain-containing protein [Verrucomicrobiia bacterium]
MQRVLLIVLLGAGLGLLNNALSPKGVPLITPPKKAPNPDEFIALEKARELWESGGFFLDARSPEDFEAGHVANALNLPVEAFDEHFVRLAPMLPPDAPVIIYCDGEDCELSHRLAARLKENGFTDVHMLFNGWTVWRKAGLPTETGATP